MLEGGLAAATMEAIAARALESYMAILGGHAGREVRLREHQCTP